MHDSAKAGGRDRARLLLAALVVLFSTVPVRSQTSLPAITLEPGEKFFRVDGTPRVLPGTNPVAFQQAGQPSTAYIQQLLDRASVNERVVRIHLTNGKRQSATTRAGAVDPAWASFWDQVFTLAEARGLWVLPVFDVWADWSSTNTGTQSWSNNPYNKTRGLGGVAANPDELLQDTDTRATWLGWLQQLVERWQDRPNILGWEPFSELDLITGADAGEATAFVEAAAAVIHAADTHHRPITASQAGVNDWPSLSSSSALDFIQIHPYANAFGYNGNLDTLILDKVRQRLTAYGKPVMIGESGLDSRQPVLSATSTTREMSSNAPVGINHAIWAAAVSGAMTTRMLWFEDGYDIFTFNPFGQTTTRLNLRDGYKNASAPVATFLADVDYSRFEPITATPSSRITGAALGNESQIIGWVRDKLSAASTDYPTTPGWPAAATLTGEAVMIAPPGRSDEWLITFYDTRTGEAVASLHTGQAADGTILVELPSFTPSIAFKIRVADEDGDGVVDSADNCVSAPNPGQENNDADAFGDACDPDDDNDGIEDGADNCQLTANADQGDIDADGEGDACEAYAFPAGGTFVIGSATPHGNGTDVTFWGARWARNNPLARDAPPDSFKGFAKSSTPPSCGGMWTSRPGNSAEPPADVPRYMAVVVSSGVSKSGSTISGNISEIVVVYTDPGYGPSPGGEGTATVVATVCRH